MKRNKRCQFHWKPKHSCDDIQFNITTSCAILLKYNNHGFAKATKRKRFVCLLQHTHL